MKSVHRDLACARAALDRGEVGRAAGHLAGALTHAPSLPEIHELLSRLAARSAGDPDALAHTVMCLCAAVGDPAPAATAVALRPYLTAVRHAVAAHGEHPMLLGAGSALARRLGETRLAVDWAGRGVRARPSKLGEIWLGYAYRTAGRMPEALAALRRAVGHDPDDLSVYADIAATLSDLGRLGEALYWTDRALRRDPDYDCVVHTAHRLRYRADGDVAHLVRLADFSRAHPDDAHEHTDLADGCRGTAWLGGLPDTAHELPPGRTSIDAEPAAETLRRLARVATPAWPHPPAAYDRAVELLLVEPFELLAALHRADVTTAVWACLGLLHHDTEQPWSGSTRRLLLLGLLTGGTDRITVAAFFALVTYAWVDPRARPEVAALVATRLAETAAGPGGRAVAELALATPGLDRSTRELAAATLRVPVAPRQRRRWRWSFTR